jgi:fatty-acyl-CoA synthase
MWNNQEHVEAYCAVPAMGAVLHTLNIRLAEEQIAYIANHAEDEVVIVDASLVEVLAPVLPRMATVHTVLVAGEGDMSPLKGTGKLVVSYDEFIADQPTDYAWPELDERSAAAMCYTSGTTATRKVACTAIGRPICIPWPFAPREPWRLDLAISCSPSRRCSMRMPGV